MNNGSHTPTNSLNSTNRACTNCVHAKAKCTALSSSSTNIVNLQKCERCRRMNKDCRPSPPMRKRRPTAAVRSAKKKTSKLEEKVDGLVMLLKSATQQPIPAPTNSVSVNFPPESIVASIVDNTHYPDNTHNSHVLNSSILSEFDFSPYLEDSELCLNTFRITFTQHLPFIAISPSLTAHQLRQERPCLWICIMTITSTNSMQQAKMADEVSGLFACEAFVEGTRNMDLLLAVLVFASWDRNHCFEKPILTGLVQLALAILYDLGLDKPPPKDSNLVHIEDLKENRSAFKLPRSRTTMEERRALLGCFLLSSVLSYLGKGDALRWTAYSDECLCVLETEKEFTSDALLVQLVKLRLIYERAVDAASSCEQNVPMRPPAMFYFKSLEAQIQTFKINIPQELADNETLLMELNITELAIHDIGLAQGPDIFNSQHNQWLECLYSCLNAAKSWFDIFLAIPTAQYVGFSILTYSNLRRCFMATYRLSTLEHPEWDQTLVRETLDIVLLLDEAEKKFSEVNDAARLDVSGSSESNYYAAFASKIRMIRIMWDAITTPFGAALGDEMADFSTLLDDNWV